MNKKLLWHWRCCGFNKAKALTTQTTESKVCTVYKNSVFILLNTTLDKKKPITYSLNTFLLLQSNDADQTCLLFSTLQKETKIQYVQGNRPLAQTCSQ